MIAGFLSNEVKILTGWFSASEFLTGDILQPLPALLPSESLIESTTPNACLLSRALSRSA